MSSSNKWNKQKSEDFLSPTLSRKFVLKKYIFGVMPSLKGKRLVEFGSGNGFWLKQFSNAGAICIGVDSSLQQINLAKKKVGTGTIFLKQNAASFKTAKKFDVVYIDHVLSETSSLKEITKILKSARLALKAKGILVLNEMHPSVVQFPFTKMKTESNSYFKSGSKVHFEVKQADGTYIKITDYHWTMHDYVTALRNAGFIITEVVEPQAPKTVSDEYLKLRQQFPSHIIIKAVPQ